jgi:hypothetical protein
MATVRFPDAEAMAVVRRIACDTDDSARCSWATLKSRLSEGGVQVRVPLSNSRPAPSLLLLRVPI